MRSYLKYYKSILHLAFPLFLGQLGNIAVGFADNIMVGHYSTDALASASFVNNVFNIAIFACMGFSYGLTPLLGALFAKGEPDKIGRMVRVGLRINNFFTIGIMSLMVVLYFFLHRLGQPEELLPLIRPYYLLALAGAIPLTIFNVFSQWSFAINRTGLPTWIVLTANAFNVLGNYILIYGHFGAPELGLVGAGISTLVARIGCMVVMSMFFFHGRVGQPYVKGFRYAPAQKGEARKIFRTGFPVSMQMAFETASFSGSAVFAGWLGAVSLAAFQIVSVSGMLGFCIYYAVGAAMAIPVSHAAGHHDNHTMRRSAWAGYHIILFAMVLVCCLFLFCGKYIMGVFSNDEAVIGLSVSILVPMALYQLGDATQITFANALRGTSKVTPMLYIAFVSYIVVGLPLSYVFGFPLGMGLYGIVLSFSVCLMLAGALYLIYFLKATNSHKN